jgi:ABC-type nitrate/sulfonate/bicarbonate transport system permease component
MELQELLALGRDCGLSLQRVLIGVALAAIFGTACGLVRGALPPPWKKNRWLRLFIEAPKFPPPIAWIPFVILVFGIGDVSAYAIVFIGAFSPIFINAYEGVESIPVLWRQTAASLGFAGWRYFVLIAFRGALPQIFVGLRAGISMGWMSVIAAEMVSGQSGLGYAIQLDRLNLQYGLMAVHMLFIGLIGFVLFEGVTYAERIFIPWHERVAV